MSMTTIEIYKLLSDREHELERKRTTSLARAQWATVIELDAKLEEVHLWRKKIANAEQTATNEAMQRTMEQAG